jgi:hypothetical protein
MKRIRMFGSFASALLYLMVAAFSARAINTVSVTMRPTFGLVGTNLAQLGIAARRSGSTVPYTVTDPVSIKALLVQGWLVVLPGTAASATTGTINLDLSRTYSFSTVG